MGKGLKNPFKKKRCACPAQAKKAGAKPEKPYE
jgi:hypothetical protein